MSLRSYWSRRTVTQYREPKRMVDVLYALSAKEGDRLPKLTHGEMQAAMGNEIVNAVKLIRVRTSLGLKAAYDRVKAFRRHAYNIAPHLIVGRVKGEHEV